MKKMCGAILLTALSLCVTTASLLSAPVANNQTVGPLSSGVQYAFYLSYSGTPTSFTILTQPQHGTLSAHATVKYYYYYRSEPGFAGSDSFTWRCADSSGNSDPATCTINVANTPSVNNQSFTVAAAGQMTINLSYVLNSGLSPTFTILSGPSHGTLAVNPTTPSQYIYEPVPYYTGSDSFTWRVNNGYNDSAIATVSINVKANTAPTANNQSLQVNSFTRNPISLSVTDPDAGQFRTYTLVKPPAHGTVIMPDPIRGTGFAIYISDNNYIGDDSFQWKVNDGLADSNVATVSLTNKASVPVPLDQFVHVATNRTTVFGANFTGGSGYNFTIKPGYLNGSIGTITANGRHFVFTPKPGYSGIVTVKWKIEYSNDTTPLTSTVERNCNIYVRGNIADGLAQNSNHVIVKGRALSAPFNHLNSVLPSFSIVTQPANGTVSISNDSFIYTPNTNFEGADSFTWKLREAASNDYSNVATCNILVRKQNDRAGMKVLLLVKDTIQPEINGELNRWKQDLLDEGYTVEIKPWSSASAADLWIYLVEEYTKPGHFLAGATLFGNLPTLGGLTTNQTTDYALMNMLKYRDNSLNNQHIWISRLRFIDFEGGEIKRMKWTMDANHNYRKGLHRLPYDAFWYDSAYNAVHAGNAAQALKVWPTIIQMHPTQVFKVGGEYQNSEMHGNDAFPDENNWHFSQLRYSIHSSCGAGSLGGPVNRNLSTYGGGCILSVGSVSTAYSGQNVAFNRPLSFDALAVGETFGSLLVLPNTNPHRDFDRTMHYGDLSLPAMVAPSNAIPVINSFTASSLQGVAPYQINFGVSATDPDGTIVHYEWFPEGFRKGMVDPHASGVSTTFSHTYTKPYRYCGVEVHAVDNYMARGYEAKTILIAPDPTKVMRVQCGYNLSQHHLGYEYTDCSGQLWLHDQQFAAGTWGYSSGDATNLEQPVTGTDDDLLYQRFRSGSLFSYRIPLANGSYLLRLHLADMQSTAAGQRLMDVKIEDVVQIKALDVFAEAGAKTAYTTDCLVKVEDGEMNFVLGKNIASLQNIFLNAFEIIPYTGNDLPPVALNQDLAVLPNNPVEITLAVTNPANASLSYTIVDQPQHGTLSAINGDKIVYTPVADYLGGDYFTFRVTSSYGNSNIGRISLSVTAYPEGWSCYVRGDGLGNDSNSGTSWSNAWATLGKAWLTLPDAIAGRENIAASVPRRIYIQASSGNQVYDALENNRYFTYDVEFHGGWENVDNLPVQSGYSTISDTNSTIEKAGISIVKSANHTNWRRIRLNNLRFENVVNALAIKHTSNKADVYVIVSNCIIRARADGFSLIFNPNYAADSFGGYCQFKGWNLDIIAGLGGAGDGVRVDGYWNNSLISAVGNDPATGLPRVSRIAAPNGKGVNFTAYFKDLQPIKATIERTVIHDCSGHGMDISAMRGGAVATAAQVQLNLVNCTVANNAGDGLYTVTSKPGSFVAITNSIFAKNSGYGANLDGSNFTMLESHNVFYDDALRVNGSAQSVATTSSTGDPLFTVSGDKPVPWYTLSGSGSPAWQSATDGGHRGALQAAGSNRPPVANNQNVTAVAGEAKLTVLSGSDPDGDPLTYAITAQPSHGTLGALNGNQVTYTANANYSGSDSFKFRVNDGKVNSAEATVSISVTAANRPPTVTAGANPASGSTPLVVSFTATASDPDGDTLSYAWTFGDGGTSNQQNPSHTYNDAGTYNAKVTVSDGNGGTASDTVQITATPGLFPLTINTAGTGEGIVNVSPPGLQYTNGTQITLTAVPTSNSNFAGWSGKVSGQQNPITFTMNGSATVTATFDIKTFTITSLASTDGGTISPQGAVQVPYGGSQSFTITPFDGYLIENVLTNGYPVGAVSSFTFHDVQSDHTIQAFFKVDDTPPTITSALVATGTVGQAFSYQITATHSPHSYDAIGLPEGLSVDTGTGLISGTPAVGVVTNVSISALNNGGCDTKQLALTINCLVEATAGANGSITLSGTQLFAGGTSPVFNINPAQWYAIADVAVDGVSVGKPASYTFVNISTNHTIAATFSAQLAPLGTPLWWLAQYLEINDGFDAAELLDSDNDGFANWREYQLGTDPTDPLSRPDYNVVPYAESFEDLSGFGGTYGLIYDFKGWFVEDSGDQSRIVNAPQPLSEEHLPLPLATHTNILQFSTSDKTLINSFGDGFDMGSQRLYVDQAMLFEMCETVPSQCASNDNDIKMLLFANKDNKLCVYHGVADTDGSLISNRVSVTDTIVSSDTWYRVTIAFDTIPQSQAPLMFSVRINGQLVKSSAAYAGTWKAAYNVNNEMPATDLEGCWFRSATGSGDDVKQFRSVNYTGTGCVDDLVVTTVDPFDDAPGFETFLLSVTGSGSGSTSLGSLPYVSVVLDSGSSTQVVYTAADWYRIAALTANGAPVNEAVGQRCYTQQIASISGNISNAVVFAEATQSQAGHGDVPLSWLKQWREDTVVDQGDGFDVATKYLLGLDPTSYNTFALTITDLKIDGNKVITTVKRNVTGDLAPDGMAGYLKLQIAEQLGDTFETIVDTPITGATVFDANDCHTYTNTLDITTRFIRAVIE